MFDSTTVIISTVLVVAAWPLVVGVWGSLRQWLTLRHLPCPPVHSWLWGHLFLSPQSPLILADWTAKYGSVYRIRLLTNWAVVVTDPALVRAVLQSSKTYVPKNGRLYRGIEAASHPALPNILSSSDAGAPGSDGRYWAAVRAAWMKCFTSPNLKRMLPTVISCCECIIEQQTPAAAAAAAGGADATTELGSNASAAAAAATAVPVGWSAANMCELTDRITLDVIGVLAYGRDFGAVAEKRSRYLQLVSGMLALMHEEMHHPIMRLLNSFKPDKKKDQLRKEWDAANTAEVMAAMSNPPGEHTIAGQLLQVLDPATGKPLSVDQLKAEMVIAALAGFETTSNALSWTLGALACHPRAMQQLEQELDGVGLLATPQNPIPTPFTWHLLGKLQYLQAVIREGLRLFSPAANGSFRFNAAADLQLREDLVVPKGTPVGVPLFAFGHNPETYGPDVEAFRPDRWLPGRPSTSGSNHAAVDANPDSTQPNAIAADASSETEGHEKVQKSMASSVVAAGVGQAVRPAGQAVRPAAPQDPWSFSIGPRDCAGQALARMELQVVIAMLVGHLEIRLLPSVGGWQGLLQRRMYHTTLQIEGGLPLLLRPRATADLAG